MPVVRQPKKVEKVAWETIKEVFNISDPNDLNELRDNSRSIRDNLIRNNLDANETTDKLLDEQGDLYPATHGMECPK